MLLIIEEFHALTEASFLRMSLSTSRSSVCVMDMAVCGHTFLPDGSVETEDSGVRRGSKITSDKVGEEREK